MATYHCSMSIGSAGKTMAHLQYIKREGKYNKEDDLMYTSSGNLPSWAMDENEYWEAIAAHDVRSYRSLIIALPNEFPLEVHKEIVEEMIDQILPNHTYTYAIHEQDSAVHGIKNPHVHIMFSERINDDSVRDLPKEEYLKKRGTARDGSTFGGSVKDRSWAGRGATKKIYEVRQQVAESINAKYKAYDLPQRVTHKSFRNLTLEALAKGDASATLDAIQPSIRVNEKAFIPHLEVLQKALQQELPEQEIEALPKDMQYRIYQEQYKALSKESLVLKKEYEASLEPTPEQVAVKTNEMAYALNNVNEFSQTPFSYFKKNVHIEDMVINESLLPSPTLYTDILATEIADEAATNTVVERIEDANLSTQFIADLERTKKHIQKERARIESTDMLRSVLSTDDTKQLVAIEYDARKNYHPEAFAKQQGIVIPDKTQLEALATTLRNKRAEYTTPELLQKAKDMKQDAMKWKKIYEPKPFDFYVEKMINKRFDNALFKLNGKIRSLQSKIEYNESQGKITTRDRQRLRMLELELNAKRASYQTMDVIEDARRMQAQHAEKYEKIKIRPVQAYVDRLIDQSTNFEIANLKKELRQEQWAYMRKVNSFVLKEQRHAAQKNAHNTVSQYIDALKLTYQEQLVEAETNKTKQLEQLQQADDTINTLQLAAMNRFNVDKDKVEEAKEKSERVQEKHETLTEVLDQKANEAIQEAETTVDVLYKSKRSLEYYQFKHINEAGGGRLEPLREKLRSKESLLKYLEKQHKDTYFVEEEIKQLKSDIKTFVQVYGKPDVLAKAKQEYEAMQNKGTKAKKNVPKTKSRLAKIFKSKRIPAKTRAKAANTSSVLDKLFSGSNSGNDTPAIATFRTGSDYDMDRPQGVIR